MHSIQRMGVRNSIKTMDFAVQCPVEMVVLSCFRVSLISNQGLDGLIY